MSTLYPLAWLLLLPALALCYSQPFRNQRLTLLRLLLYVVLIALLAGTSIQWHKQAGVVIALVDRSRSLPVDAQQQSEKIIRELERARPADCQLGVISFAGGHSWEKLPGPPAFDGLKAILPDHDNSNLADALDAALRSLPANRSNRILLLSDGQFNGPSPSRGFAEAAARQLAVDWRLLRRQTANDLAILKFSAPWRAAPQEFYTLTCQIWSPEDQEALCRLRCNGGPEQSYRLTLRTGSNYFSWRDSHPAPAVLDYELSITGTAELPDELPENNRARRIVSIRGRKALLLLTEAPSGNLAKLLLNAGLPVLSRPPAPTELLPEKLSGYAGVILENVPAGRLSLSGMETLAALVKAGHLGLLMTGGRSSFAVGGYYRSPIEEILPVALEQRQDIRKNSLAMVVALDRSGSMAMSCGQVSKMDLANRATLEVFHLLQSNDEFSVIAVDSQAHTVFPLTPVHKLAQAPQKILSIESMGGGIYTYTALHQATNALLASAAVTRHLLLFADANDAEEPGEYRQLLRRTAAAGITVSVVGLGSEKDIYADFLQEVAKLGNGQCYFTEHPDELPRIFAEDTFLMAYNTFIDSPVRGDFTNALRTISSSENFPTSLEFGGYNLCCAKPSSENILLTADAQNAPLAAVGYAGLGRVAALAVEADGKYSGAFASHPAAGTLLAALTNWMLVPEESPTEEFCLNQEIIDGNLRLELLLAPDRQQDPFPHLPSVSVLAFNQKQQHEPRNYRLGWETPHRLSCFIPLSGEDIYLSSISWPGQRPLTLAPVTLPYSPEYLPASSQDGQNKLAQTTTWAAATGGQLRLQAADIWKDLPAQHRRLSLTPWLALLAILLLLLEVAERRLELSRHLHRPAVKPASEPVVAADKSSTRPAPQPTKPITPTTPEKNTPGPVLEHSDDSLGEALRRARRK